MISKPDISIDYSDKSNFMVILNGTDEDTQDVFKYIYDNPQLQDPKFPVIKMGDRLPIDVSSGNDVIYNYPQLAPNMMDNYAVIDLEEIERTRTIQLSYGKLADLENTEGSDDDDSTSGYTNSEIIQMYRRAKRKLIAARNSVSFEFDVKPLPQPINIGDKLELNFNPTIYEPDASGCALMKGTNVYSSNGWYYITQIVDHSNYSTITLSNVLSDDED